MASSTSPHWCVHVYGCEGEGGGVGGGGFKVVKAKTKTDVPQLWDKHTKTQQTKSKKKLLSFYLSRQCKRWWKQEGNPWCFSGKHRHSQRGERRNVCVCMCVCTENGKEAEKRKEEGVQE
jgi:hypothetical protein